MTEELLHHIWKFRLFNPSGLRTTENQSLEIIKAGEHNQHAGPDFFNAKMKIEETTWVGNVEVHIYSSDWTRHRHQQDKSYDNIILHVVFESDRQIFRSSGEPIPTLELKGRIAAFYYRNYLDFKRSNDWIPCEKQIKNVPNVFLNATIDRLLVERLEEKSAQIRSQLDQNKMNWEETFYQMLARNFGFKTNALPFELLSKSLPSSVLAKHRDSRLQLEALLFGQAGFLENYFLDRYPQQLQNEYVFLRHKFKLSPVDNHLWKFLRLRPYNFPTIRIAQFAGMIHQSNNLFSRMMETKTLIEVKKLMSVEVSGYWKEHYVFEKKGRTRNKSLGEESIQNIIINTLVPFLFVYGKVKSQEIYKERALLFLEQIQGEQNSIITRWKEIFAFTDNAYTTQSLLQLKNSYCDKKQCLRCAIGHFLLKKP